MAIRYTPGQLRDALGLTKETLRYWRRDLPVLDVARGQRTCFGPGDLLATAIVKRVTETAGVPVSRLASIAEELFAQCRASAWPQLERMTTIILLDENEVKFVPVEMNVVLSKLSIVVPLKPLVTALREHLHEPEADTQTRLAFPPFAISARANQ